MSLLVMGPDLPLIPAASLTSLSLTSLATHRKPTISFLMARRRAPVGAGFKPAPTRRARDGF